MRVRRSVERPTPRRDAANPVDATPAEGPEAPGRTSWRAGAVEIPASFIRTRAPRNGNARLSGWRPVRPALLAIFMLAFAGLGMGFGGLDDPPTVFAPGTPQAEVAVVRVAEEHVTPSSSITPDFDVFGSPEPGRAFAAEVQSTATPAVSPTLEATATPTEAPATPTPVPATSEPTQPPPTATPTSPPQPAWQPYPQTQLTEAELRTAASTAGWPVELHDQLVAVAWCESRFQPNASTRYAYGIMQLVPSWFEYAGEDFANWMDPVVNLRVAYRVYLYDIGRGHAPWFQWVCTPPAATAPEATPAPATTSTPLAWPESSATAAAATDAGGEASADE